MFEKPHGMRDTPPGLYETKKRVRSALLDVIGLWGYRFVETPTLEFYETVGVQSAILEQQPFKPLDQEGKTLVPRPDMTGPIARVAASQLLKQHHPIRVGYAHERFQSAGTRRRPSRRI